MDKFFDNFYNFNGFGPAISQSPVPDKTIEAYQGILPNKLLEYWKHNGWCGYGNGIFWTVNPEEWQDVLKVWIGQVDLPHKDNYHVIARTAFGGLFLWGEHSGASLRIYPAWGMIYPSFHIEEYLKDGSDFSIQLFFSGCKKEYMDFIDEDQNYLFDRAVKKLGPLDENTIYGFVPALVTGGQAKLDNLQRLDVFAHLEFLAQIGPRKIMEQVKAFE